MGKSMSKSKRMSKSMKKKRRHSTM
jgi:hypothetical protein